MRRAGQPRRLRAVFVIGCVLGTSGCSYFTKKEPRVFAPPPVAARMPETVEVVIPDPPDAGDVEPAPPTSTAAALEFPKIPPPPPPSPPAPAKRPPSTPPPDEVVEVAPAPTAAPKPAQIFSADERLRLNRELDESLTRVRRILARVSGMRLTQDQQDISDRVRTFLIQAEQAREEDLVTAVNLARRADLLAIDLNERLP